MKGFNLSHDLSNFIPLKFKVMSNIQEEIWKDIPGYEGKYQASTHGRIKSLPRKSANNSLTKERIIKATPNSRKYMTLHLFKDGIGKCFLLHRLIAITFIPNPLNEKEINHINGIKSDNGVENLEWCNRIHNCRHVMKTGLRNNKLNTQVIPIIKEAIEKGFTHSSIAAYFKVSRQAITHIAIDSTWNYPL